MYDAVGAPRDLASFVPGRVSLPPSVVGCSPVEEIAGEEGRLFMKENQKRMRRSISENNFDAMPAPYCDPVLKRNKKVYCNFPT